MKNIFKRFEKISKKKSKDIKGTLSPELKEKYYPLPSVVDVWRFSFPVKEVTSILFACAPEYSYHSELENKLCKRCTTFGKNKPLNSIEYVSGRFLTETNCFSKIPTNSFKMYNWGNYFLFWGFQASKTIRDMTLIKKTNFTHQFTYYPGIPRLQRSKLIEKFAKDKLLNTSILYSWTGRPKSLEESPEDLLCSGMSDADFKYKFKHFDNQRKIFYDGGESLLADNHQRIDHTRFPLKMVQAAPFNITMESDPDVPFLTEKTYRTLASGVIPLLTTRYKHYTYLESLGFKFPQIVLDFKSTITFKGFDSNRKFYDDCNRKMLELVNTLRDNWSDELLSECIECGIHNQLNAAKIVAGGVGVPESKYVQLYYSKIINESRHRAVSFLRRQHIHYTLPPPLPYIGAFNHNEPPQRPKKIIAL